MIVHEFYRKPLKPPLHFRVVASVIGQVPFWYARCRLNLSAEVSQTSLQLIEAVEFKLKAGGAHEINTMWIELLVSGKVRLGTFTPHLVLVLAPVVWLFPVHNAQRCCEQCNIARRECVISKSVWSGFEGLPDSSLTLDLVVWKYLGSQDSSQPADENRKIAPTKSCRFYIRLARRTVAPE